MLKRIATNGRHNSNSSGARQTWRRQKTCVQISDWFSQKPETFDCFNSTNPFCSGLSCCSLLNCLLLVKRPPAVPNAMAFTALDNEHFAGPGSRTIRLHLKVLVVPLKKVREVCNEAFIINQKRASKMAKPTLPGIRSLYQRPVFHSDLRIHFFYNHRPMITSFLHCIRCNLACIRLTDQTSRWRLRRTWRA